MKKGVNGVTGNNIRENKNRNSKLYQKTSNQGCKFRRKKKT